MGQKLTLTSLVKYGENRQVEIACDYYYENGMCVGSSSGYYTGRRW
jgi:hypothetical protein